MRQSPAPPQQPPHLAALLFLHLAAVALCCLARPSSAAGHPPHLVYILSDDLGANDVVSFRRQLPPAPFVSPPPQQADALTPALDALSREALTLGAFYTSPICTPTRSALMTGRMPYHIGTQHSVIHDASPW